jgi:hypothetical protein
VLRDPSRQVRVDEEVLTERLLGTDAVPVGDRLQRPAAERSGSTS